MDPRTLARLTRLLSMYEDLLGSLPPGALEARLPARSNTIGAQLWCVVGARESYARALIEGAWAGFSCSLTAADISDPEVIGRALRTSAATVRGTVQALDWTESRDDLLLALYEHEAQHQGQLIRYVYALGYAFPTSWKERWALED